MKLISLNFLRIWQHSIRFCKSDFCIYCLFLIGTIGNRERKTMHTSHWTNFVGFFLDFWIFVFKIYKAYTLNFYRAHFTGIQISSCFSILQRWIYGTLLTIRKMLPKFCSIRNLRITRRCFQFFTVRICLIYKYILY